MKTTKMKIPRMMCGNTLTNKITNKCMKKITGFASVKEIMGSQRLEWACGKN